MVEWLKKAWMWLAGVAGAVVLFVGVYLSGALRRKGQVELEVAKRELDRANKAYDASVKKTDAIKEKQKRLVSDILAEQLKRAEELKRTKGLTDAEVLDLLLARGDIDPDSH